MIRRDIAGRVMGSGFAFYDYDEQEFWKDQKVRDVRFPNHKDNSKIGKVTTYRIGSDGELIKVN